MKKPTIALLAMLLVVILAGCASSSSGLRGEVTLKQFLDSGPRVGFVGAYKLTQDDAVYNMFRTGSGLTVSFDHIGDAGVE